MNILVRLPNWLGDAVMATFGLEILYQTYPNAHFYLIGSKVSCELFDHYPNTTTIVDTSKKATFRIQALYKLAKEIPPCEIAITFQNNFLSALFLFFNGAKKRIGYANEMRSFLLTIHPKKYKNLHESLRFAKLIETIIPNHSIIPKLYLKPPTTKITLPPYFQNQKIAGINAGAAFGSAKRWKEEYFAEVIKDLLKQDFCIILFGVESENPINEKILSYLPKNEKILNLSGKTNIQNLMAYFSKLHFLLTNDSGPMHIAAALEIPTFALFGPTNQEETSPFNAKDSHILSLKTFHKSLPCQPCKKRICPLPKNSKDYHACMLNLTPSLVLPKIHSLIS